MSIKQELERAPIEDIASLTRRLRPSVDADERDNLQSIYKGDERYRLVVFDRGKAMLDRAGTPALLQDIVEILHRIAFKDVELRKPLLLNNGGTLTTVSWDNITWKHHMSGIGYKYKLLGVVALPLTNELVVIGKKQEVLPESQWSSNEFLENAILRCFKNPMIVEGHAPASF